MRRNALFPVATLFIVMPTGLTSTVGDGQDEESEPEMTFLKMAVRLMPGSFTTISRPIRSAKLYQFPFHRGGSPLSGKVKRVSYERYPWGPLPTSFSWLPAPGTHARLAADACCCRRSRPTSRPGRR